MNFESKSAPVEQTLAPVFRQEHNRGTNSTYGVSIGNNKAWVSPKSNGDSSNWRGQTSPGANTFSRNRSASLDWRNPTTVKSEPRVNAAPMQTEIEIHQHYFLSPFSPNDGLAKPKLTRGVNFGEFVEL